MKFKTLFFSMLAAATIVSCNNDVIGGGPDGPGGDKNGGVSTTATFQLNFTNPGTYAGGADLASAGRESAVNDAALFIYKLDGTPEAMAYLISTDYNEASNAARVTVKCKSGSKLIYLAVNMGGAKLINHEESTGTSNAVDPTYLGKDWNVLGSYGPQFSSAYNDGNNNHEALNSPIWSGPSGIVLETATGFSIPTNVSADTLIRALTGFGDPTKGILSGDGGSNLDVFYLMSNWGDALNQPSDVGTGTASPYVSTCKFTLEPGVSAADSRGAGADVTNANGQNALLINIQRAVAKVAVLAIAQGVTEAAGSGTSAGKFAPGAKWALGNINTSEYPFQMWEGSIVKSTRYNETLALADGTNTDWVYKMDNSRFAGTSAAYRNQTLSASAVVNNINNGSKNVAWSANAATANYVLATENNNSQTFSHYSTFVLFEGVYTPASYITSVDNVGNPTYSNVTPTYTTSPYTSLDTMYYVGSLGTDGLFFLGLRALQEYVCYKLGENLGGGSINPYTDTKVSAYIQDLKRITGNKQADLQEYWQGHCFYRVWVKDEDAASAANKVLVRRNHAYQISITGIKSPGIGDPNDIIDPDPSTIEPLEEADTYVTATVNIMNWHVVEQGTDVKLD